jgi:hypothetical protein
VEICRAETISILSHVPRVCSFFWRVQSKKAHLGLRIDILEGELNVLKIELGNQHWSYVLTELILNTNNSSYFQSHSEYQRRRANAKAKHKLDVSAGAVSGAGLSEPNHAPSFAGDTRARMTGTAALLFAARCFGWST